MHGRYLPPAWSRTATLVMKSALVLGITMSAAWLTRAKQDGAETNQRERSLLRGLGWTFLIFFVRTPGFGVQYLAWLVPTTIFLSLRGALAYNVLAGGFLCSIYTHWCAGFPWNVANSVYWHGIEAGVGNAVWLLLAVWLVQEFRLERTNAI